MYAEVGGKPLSVVKSKETSEYIVSWLEETKKAPRGNFEIKVYDDEGYAAVRKVIANKTHKFLFQYYKIISCNLGPEKWRRYFIC